MSHIVIVTADVVYISWNVSKLLPLHSVFAKSALECEAHPEWVLVSPSIRKIHL